jgi:hypothetical protein
MSSLCFQIPFRVSCTQSKLYLCSRACTTLYRCTTGRCTVHTHPWGLPSCHFQLQSADTLTEPPNTLFFTSLMGPHSLWGAAPALCSLGIIEANPLYLKVHRFVSEPGTILILVSSLQPPLLINNLLTIYSLH